MEFEGRILPVEKIAMGNGRKCYADKDVEWGRNLYSGEILQGVDITNWVVIFPRYLSQAVFEFCKMLHTVANPMGYSVSEPRP